MSDNKNNNSNNSSKNNENSNTLVEISERYYPQSQVPVIQGNSDTKPKPSNDPFKKRWLIERIIWSASKYNFVFSHKIYIFKNLSFCFDCTGNHKCEISYYILWPYFKKTTKI